MATNHGQSISRKPHDSRPGPNDASFALKHRKQVRQAAGDARQNRRRDLLAIRAQAFIDVEAAEASTKDLATRGLSPVLLVEIRAERAGQELRQGLSDEDLSSRGNDCSFWQVWQETWGPGVGRQDN